MSTITDPRAAKMGYQTPTRAAPPPRAAAAGKSLYNTLDRSLSSYYDRRESRLRSDAEGLKTARQERVQVEAFAKKRGISADDLHEALAALHEHDLFPKSPAAIEQRRSRTLENLRLELGGQAEAKAYIEKYVKVTAELAKEVPSLAARANATGAGEDPRIIHALAHYGETPTVTTPEK